MCENLSKKHFQYKILHFGCYLSILLPAYCDLFLILLSSPQSIRWDNSIMPIPMKHFIASKDRSGVYQEDASERVPVQLVHYVVHLQVSSTASDEGHCRLPGRLSLFPILFVEDASK